MKDSRFHTRLLIVHGRWEQWHQQYFVQTSEAFHRRRKGYHLFYHITSRMGVSEYHAPEPIHIHQSRIIAKHQIHIRPPYFPSNVITPLSLENCSWPFAFLNSTQISAQLPSYHIV
jgi:hypothetical protein